MLLLPASDSRAFDLANMFRHVTCRTSHLGASVPSYYNNGVLLVPNIKPKVLTSKSDDTTQHRNTQ